MMDMRQAGVVVMATDVGICCYDMGIVKKEFHSEC